MSLFPPGYMNAVVSLGKETDNNFKHHGTGFVYAHPISSQEKLVENEIKPITSYKFFLVTNKHVVKPSVTHVRFNHIEDGMKVMPIEEVIFGQWVSHPDGADIAVANLNRSELLLGRSPYEAELFYGDCGTTFGEKYQPSEGDGVFLIGFPFDLIGKERNYPIVRHGSIARIQDWINRHEETFLIDAPAFPGNSGGGGSYYETRNNEYQGHAIDHYESPSRCYKPAIKE